LNLIVVKDSDEKILRFKRFWSNPYYHISAGCQNHFPVSGERMYYLQPEAWVRVEFCPLYWLMQVVDMSNRATKIVGILGAFLVCYCAIYFCTVKTTYLTIKAVGVAVPAYRPCDASIVHAVFAPLQLLDSTYLRPSRWHERA
jgi:hypothetical protein